MFGCIWIVSLLQETRCNLGWTGAISAKVRATKLRWNFLQQTHAVHPIWNLNSSLDEFRSVWVHLGMFRYCTKLVAILADLVQLIQQFLPRCLVEIFRNEHIWSIPLDPKLMFWCISWCLGAYGIVLLMHETWCRLCWTGATGAEVCATKLRRNFSQRMHPVHPIWP